MVTCLSWESEEISETLTPFEVDDVFNTCIQLAKMGALNGKFKHASTVLYWQRIRKAA